MPVERSRLPELPTASPPASESPPLSIDSTNFAATAAAGTKYVPAASAARMAATFSRRTHSPVADGKTSFAASLSVAPPESNALPAVAPPLFGCGTASSVALLSKSDINPLTLRAYPNWLLPDHSLPANFIGLFSNQLIIEVI